MDVSLRPMQLEDWLAVRAIYLEGIASGHATFEIDAPNWAQWDATHARDSRLVATICGTIVGWAALSPVSTRRSYAGVGEVSVYVTTSARRRGVGRALLLSLIDASEQAGYWTLQASVFPENIASIALHQSCGFREIGRRERIGQLNGRWRDVIIMERRSLKTGSSEESERS